MHRKLILLSSFVIITLASFGQNGSNHSASSSIIQKYILFEITLEENSKPEEAFVNVEKNTKAIFIDIGGSLMRGQFKIQIYDPKGKKWKRDFTVDSQYESEVFEFTNVRYIAVPDSIRNSKQPMYLGRVGIAIERPKSGRWKVMVVPEKAIGKIEVSYYTESK